MKPTKIQVGAKITPLYHQILSNIALIHEESISETIQKVLEARFTPSYLADKKAVLLKKKKEVEKILASNPNHEPSQKKLTFYIEMISNLELHIQEVPKSVLDKNYR